jgi:hypothetical protein
MKPYNPFVICDTTTHIRHVKVLLQIQIPNSKDLDQSVRYP